MLLLPTTPASQTASGTEAVAEAANILSHWHFSVEEEEETSKNADMLDNGSIRHEYEVVERTPAMNPKPDSNPFFSKNS